ncbi:MAG TPA: protein kinase, partial [Vicinamibacteria bacterium]|nr:protein kinase [Vicinamibacteria bacterium]
MCPFCESPQAVRPPAAPAVTPVATPVAMPAATPLPPSPPPAPGQTVGDRFRVVRLLGEGDFGRVYLGEALSTGTVYALKTPRDEVLRDSQASELFRREAQRWVDLERHPWLVRAFFAGEIEGRLYLATEYVASEEDGPNSLEGVLRTSPPDLAQSLRWGVQVCHAMEHALARGVRCHRDIKPANVLIGPDRAVRLCDLGIAGLPPAKAGAGEPFGTPTHMSPEHFVEAARCDERSDVYSFGVVLFQMASRGRLPFPPPALPDGPDRAARAWAELQRLHREAPVPPLDSPLAPIVARCLEKSPARRYRGFAQLRGDLEALLLHRTDEVLRVPTRTETEGWDLTSEGLGLMSLGRPREALACYERAIARNPLAAAIHRSMGHALVALGRFEEASSAFGRAADLDPQYARPPSRPAAPAPAAEEPVPAPTPAAESRGGGGTLRGGRFELRRLLGEGGFGVVHLAYDHETKAGCALKTLRDDYLADRQARATFEKEARVWAGLERHPHVVRAHAVEEIEGRVYLAMDYVAPEEPGLGSLAGHLARRPPSLARSLRWGIQLCHGMEHANARGIRCHRNVKPSNILIGQDGAVRVSDFGLAGARIGPGRGPGSVLPADPRRADTVFGTPTHMPPEQFTGAAACDVRSDVYAFGIVLYQMASGGSLPFLALVELGRPQERAARFWQEMGRLHAEAPPPPLESPLFPVIRRCLEKDPARRFPGFAEL